MRFLRQSLVGIFLAGLTLALLLYAAQLVMGAVRDRMSDAGRPTQARERIFAVNVVTAQIGTVTPVLQAYGQIQSRRTLELRAATGGRVIWLADAFEDGGSISGGETLVRLDPADAQAARDRAQNDLLDAQAEERDAERALLLARDELKAAQDQAELRDRALKRQQDLQDRGVGTAATVETTELAAAAARQSVLARRLAVAQAEARIDQAATRLNRAQIALATAERDLGDTELTAPFTGTFSAVSVVEGRRVSANEKLAELIDPDALEVAFRVSTGQYVRLLDDTGRLINSPVTVHLDASGANLSATGRVSRASAAVNEGQSGRVLFARLDAAPGFRPGDFVTVSVDEPEIDGVVQVAASALDAAGTVLVLGPDDRLEVLPVQLVRRQGDQVLLRGAGLEGREIVIGRTPLLGMGIKVRPLRQEALAETEPDISMLELSAERRARLVAFVEANSRLPAEAKAQVLSQLAQAQVPAQLVQRIEARMGG